MMKLFLWTTPTRRAHKHAQQYRSPQDTVRQVRRAIRSTSRTSSQHTPYKRTHPERDDDQKHVEERSEDHVGGKGQDHDSQEGSGRTHRHRRTDLPQSTPYPQVLGDRGIL